MSLAIDVDKVRAVLVGGTWYRVASSRKDRKKSTFSMDSYEFLWYQDHSDPDNSVVTLLGGGNERQAGVPATGFEFTVEATNASNWVMVGPISSIQAVRLDVED
jgi:hypothetical protein